ncbi:MAG: tetratricopeptide repeat protein, partial [Myxococcales bacterium]|nr:tetratricopeptide repeat protein [Myxococcales bacterium]
TAPDELPATAPDELPATATAARAPGAPAARAPDATATRAPDARLAPAPGAPAALAPAPGTTPGGDVETAAALFERAERALAAGDRDGARAALRRLLDRFAGEPLADDARYQLARLARHDPPAALAYLDAIRSPSLAEPAAFLRCAVKADAGHADAATCLEAFRQTHPRSAHGDDALLRLAELHFRRGDCAGAAPLLADFLRRHPDHAQARARLARCQDPGAAR